jgi:hypothetical protein
VDEAKDWRTALLELVADEELVHGALQECALDLRRALLRGPLAQVRAQVERHQACLDDLSRLTQRGETLCHQAGLLPPERGFTLRLLADSQAVREDEHLREQMDQLLASVARSATEMAHNRYLIGRLWQWTEIELRRTVEPLLEGPGCPENGSRRPRAPEAAWLDPRVQEGQ